MCFELFEKNYFSVYLFLLFSEKVLSILIRLLLNTVQFLILYKII